jgi:hypothetical protein
MPFLLLALTFEVYDPVLLSDTVGVPRVAALGDTEDSSLAQ